MANDHRDQSEGYDNRLILSRQESMDEFDRFVAGPRAMENNNNNNRRLLVASFSSGNQSYSHTGIPAADDLNISDTEQREETEFQSRARRRSSFREYLSHAFSYKPTSIFSSSSHQTKANYYTISSLLCVNVLVSILNTILLSFVVKSLQLGGDGHIGLLLGEKLTWMSEHLEGMILDLPVSITQGKSLVLSSIESDGPDNPLMIKAYPDEEGESSEAFPQEEDGAHQPIGGISISTGEAHQPASRIVMRAGDRPVELMTDLLVMDQLTSLPPPISDPPKVGSASVNTRESSKWRSNQRQRLRDASPRRWLEMDTRRKSLALPRLHKIELCPRSSASLYVNDLFACDSGVTGMLGANLE